VSIGPGASLRQRQKDDLSYYSVPALLHFEDRNSMAHSIEARVPMLDYELASFAVNCRPSLKLRNGWTKWKG
jgi:asparagine synthase (glutamine-hydrolysing)